MVGQAWATQRHVPRGSADEPALVARMTALATGLGRYDYRRVTALPRRDVWRVNHRRVERTSRREGLNVPAKQPKRGRHWLADGPIVRMGGGSGCSRSSTSTHESASRSTWHDGCSQRRCSHASPSGSYVTACRSTSTRTTDPELTAQTARRWLRQLGGWTLFIEPGSPREKGYMESLNGSCATSTSTWSGSRPGSRCRCWSSAGAASTTSCTHSARSATAREHQPEPVTPRRLARVVALTQDW